MLMVVALFRIIFCGKQ